MMSCTEENLDILKPQKEGEYQTIAGDIEDCDAFEEIPKNVSVLV